MQVFHELAGIVSLIEIHHSAWNTVRGHWL